MRAREPDHTGYAVNNGVRIYYEVHGRGPQTMLFVAPHQIVNGRIWKMQVPFLARHLRAVLYDGRGSGRSDRPASGYTLDHLVDDAVGVLDELSIARCALLAEGSSSRVVAALAARHPERVAAIVFLSPRLWGAPRVAPGQWEAWKHRYAAEFDAAVRYEASACFSEPHSTKVREDFWDWAHETDPGVILTATEECWAEADARPLLPELRCPVLLIHGRQNPDLPYEQSVHAHGHLPNSHLVTIETPGQFPAGRDPVRINLLLREFLDRIA